MIGVYCAKQLFMLSELNSFVPGALVAFNHYLEKETGIVVAVRKSDMINFSVEKITVLWSNKMLP